MAVAGLIASWSAALADDCAAPCIGYAITGEIEDDWIFSARPPSGRSNDLGPTVDTEISLVPLEHLKLASAVTIEQVVDPAPGADRAFADIGAYVEQLHGDVDLGPLSVRLGKFNPAFGLASDELDGIEATDLVGNYDTDERWGAEAALTFEALGLFQSLTASLFTTDRTALSDSFFTSRGRASLSDGGAGNTRGISSAAVFLDGCKGAETSSCYEDGDFGYRLGLRYQRAGQATQDEIADNIVPRAELGYLAAATARLEGDGRIVRILGEMAYFRDFLGGASDVVTGTVAASLESGAMNYMASYSLQKTLIGSEPQTIEQLADVTAIYAFDEDDTVAGGQWKLSAGYSYSRGEAGETAHTLGLVLAIDLDGTLWGRGTPEKDDVED